MSKQGFRGFSRNQEWHALRIEGHGIAWIGWSKAKNKRVMQKHSTSFEAAVVSIAENGLGRLLPHGNVTKYPDQFILEQEVSGIPCRIPCELIWSANDEPCFFLRTIVKI
ncbi:MAG: hypothetical protein PSX71_14105 [bacterium]|nr:hypothetical protein [bacterium]